MRRKYFATTATARTALLDATIAAISVLVSIAIRANFRDFLVQAAEVALLGPFIVLSRAGTMAFFEHYSYSRTIWQPRDFTAIFVHNLLPTGVLILLRFVSPLRILRFPLSVILLEYVISVFLMILVRVADAGRKPRPNNSPIYRPRIAVYGEIQDLSANDTLRKLQAGGDVVIRAVLSPNPLHWDTDYAGIRVVGDEHALPELIRADDSISHVIIANPEVLPAARRKELEREAAGCRVTAVDVGRFSNPAKIP